MKNIIYLLILTLGVSLTSCKKENVDPITSTITITGLSDDDGLFYRVGSNIDKDLRTVNWVDVKNTNNSFTFDYTFQVDDKGNTTSERMYVCIKDTITKTITNAVGATTTYDVIECVRDQESYIEAGNNYNITF